MRIVITGAPASGKTVFFERLKSEPMFAKYVFFDELARQLLAEYPAYRTHRTEFHRQIYYRQVQREDALGGQSFVTDRGTVDAFAFHPETASLVGTTLKREYERYDLVVHLESAARLGEAFYQTDIIRTESPEDALIIEDAISQVWRQHPNYRFVSAHQRFEDKWTEFLGVLSRPAGGRRSNKRAVRASNE